MSAQGPARSGRETRLLIATIAISIAVLVLLARFRFPDQPGLPVPEPVTAPLERLAARATYDELAAMMADLERRLLPRLTVVEVVPDRPAGRYAVAVRMTPNRAVLLLASHESLARAGGTAPPVIARDNVRDVAVVSVPEAADAVVTLPTTAPRPGPRYIAVVEATAQGPVIRPVYIGRTDTSQDPRTGSPLLSVAAVQQILPRGAAIFSLAGNFIGLAAEGGSNAMIVPGDILRASADAARQIEETRGDLGLTVQALTRSLTRATGAERGVVISHVHPQGPAAGILESGDVVTAIDGTPVSTPAGFLQLAQSRPPGSEARLDVTRRGKPMEVTLAVQDATALPQPAAANDDPGFVLRTVPELGAEVVSVRAGTAASRAGLETGDIIVRLDGRDGPTAAALMTTWRQAGPGAAILLSVQRGPEHLVTALER